MEPLMGNEFVNLRRCTADGDVCENGESCDWVQTQTTDGNGQYVFNGVEEGEYFIGTCFDVCTIARVVQPIAS